MSSLWEILVPTQWNTGKPVRTRHHREWDKRIRKVSGGLTIFQPVKGQWIAPDSTLFAERMIPVRFIAKDMEEVDLVINITMKHYDQLAVLCYKISDQIVLTRK